MYILNLNPWKKMVQGFEKFTEALTAYERDLLVPVLCEGLKRRIGSKYAIRNREICAALARRGYEKVTEARVRKCINHIRVKGLVPHLGANSRGYYVATSVEEVEQYVQSLKEREEAIGAVRRALVGQLSGKLFI